MSIKYNRDALIRGLQAGQPLSDLVNRRTGQSTAQALRILAEAMDHPGRCVPIKDHHGTHHTDRELTCVVIRIIERLDLQGMAVSRDGVRSGFAEEFHV